MGKIYQLDCRCGRALQIPETQAGSVQPCPECGERVEVPTLRELRRLPVAGSPPPAAGSASRWGVGQGMAFSVGLLLAAVCLLAILLLARQRRTLTVVPPDLDQLHSHADTDRLTPSQLWRGWVQQFRDERLEARATPEFLVQRARYRRLTGWMWAAGAGVVLGAAMAATAALLARPRSPTPS